MVKDEIHEVLQCYHGCPFFSIEGMEHMMYCNHPFWNTQNDAYAGAIIDHHNSHGRVPDKCPLKAGPIMLTKRVSLESKV